jgi:lipopolysaccharide transport protein LptA
MTWTQTNGFREPLQSPHSGQWASVRALLTLCALCTLSLRICAAPAELKGSGEEMLFQADSTDLDLKSSKSTSYKITMTQGSWTMTADEGRLEWQDDKNGEWNLKGKVQLRGPGSEIDAEEARVIIGSNQIQLVNFIGSPATFRQFVKEGKIAEGRATSMQYDVNKNLVSLVGNAVINMGLYELTNAAITYDLREQKVVANNPSPSTGRVKGRIKQRADLNK